VLNKVQYRHIASVSVSVTAETVIKVVSAGLDYSFSYHLEQCTDNRNGKALKTIRALSDN